MDTKLPVDELLRLACIYAENDQQEYLRCIENAGPDDPEVIKTKAFLEQLRAYRLKRWGKTRLEDAMGKAKPVPIFELAKRLTEPNA